MAGSCPGACGDVTLLRNPLTNCVTDIRQKTLSRIAFYDCNTTLPDPITGASIKTLFDNGTIVASMPLGNIQWGEPTTEDLAVDDCSPARQFITGREMTFEDRVALSNTTGSPAVTDSYFDYDFWQDKMDKQFVVRYMLIYCDGDVVIPRDKNGNPLGATMLVYINFQKAQTQGGASTEFKRGSVRFAGDPLALYTAKPAFNYIEAGITL